MINSVQLERMTVAAQTIVNRAFADDFGNIPDVRFVEYAARELALQLRQHVYGEQLDQRTIRYPETWRDAVKDRLYAWLRSGHWPWGADLMERRWPVKWHETNIDVTAFYPKISMPHERHSIRVAQMHDTSDVSQRLWFDAKGHDLFDTLYRLYHEGRMGKTWHANYPVYYEIAKMRMSNGDYLFAPPYNGEATIFGMKVIVDRDMPKDTIELRDKDDRIVGKIYNIG